MAKAAAHEAAAHEAAAHEDQGGIDDLIRESSALRDELLTTAARLDAFATQLQGQVQVLRRQVPEIAKEGTDCDE